MYTAVLAQGIASRFSTIKRISATINRLMSDLRSHDKLYNDFSLELVVFYSVLYKVEQYKLISLRIKANIGICRIFDNKVNIKLPRFNLMCKRVDDLVDLLLKVTDELHFCFELASAYLHPFDMIVTIEPHSNTRLFYCVEQFQRLVVNLYFRVFTTILSLMFLIHQTHQDVS